MKGRPLMFCGEFCFEFPVMVIQLLYFLLLVRIQSSKFLVLHQILDKMKKGTSDIEGVLIEDNGFCISVHYRHVAHVVSFTASFLSLE